jgi:hypothetical protein
MAWMAGSSPAMTMAGAQGTAIERHMRAVAASLTVILAKARTQ